MTAQLIQFGVSLLAIFALAWLVHRLRLGGDKRVGGEAQARQLAGEVADGFDADKVAVDSEGRSALLSDAQGQIMVLKMHGSKAAGRILGPASRARVCDRAGKQELEVCTGEHWFGNVVLNIREYSAWKQAIDTIGQRGDA